MSRSLVIVALIVGLLVPRFARAEEATVELWMPDGQLATNPVRVYVTRAITLGMKPKLRLLGSHAITKRRAGEEKDIEPLRVASGQTWGQTSPGGNRVQRSGSLLLFDLSTFPIPRFKSMMRLTPVLEWTENDGLHTAVGGRAVNVGNPVTAWGTSVAIMAVALLLILAMLRRRVGLLLRGDDGHISLSRLQIAVWTLAVGTIVFGHGLIQLDVPSIPESIVALLGLSLATGGISYLQPKRDGDPPPGAAAVPASWSFADLVSDDGVPSISRAQMIFWTLLMVTLFVAKSVLNGVVWEVPWAMVALMGMSQGSYLAPKFVPPK